MNLNKEYLRTCLSEYMNQNLNIEDIVINRFEAQTGDGNKKEFYRIVLGNQRSFILKYYPESDISQGLSNDQDFREIQFTKSDVMQRLKEAVNIPIIASYLNDDERWILMEDVTESLSQFGPPKIPTKEQLKSILYNIGQLHAITWEDNELFNNSEWFMQFSDFIEGGCRLLHSLIMGDTNESWINEYLAEHPDAIDAFAHFMNYLEEQEKNKLIDIIMHPEYIINNIDNSQKALCHNDLYYGNIGLNKGSLVIIDWEFVGVSPSAWDVYNLYSGIPCEDLKEEEAFEIYFKGLEESGIKVDQDAWKNTYELMGVISNILELRVLVPKVFANNARIPEEKKTFVQNHIKHMVQHIIQHIDTRDTQK